MRLSGIRGVAAALVLPASLLLAPAAGAGPKIRLQSTSEDYGKVPIERIVRHRFRYQNAGDAPLRITNQFCHANLITTKALEGC